MGTGTQFEYEYAAELRKCRACLAKLGLIKKDDREDDE
jgi:hypothetical protein